MEDIKVRESLFQRNHDWASAMTASDPDFFKRLAAKQDPEYLWIGCSDSRVQASELLGLPPGELFVHRNIANVVSDGDLSCLSVLQFAVNILKVKHIFIVGHYGCSGVHAALTKQRIGLADHWLQRIEEVYEKHRLFLDKEPSEATRYDRLCELNSIEQAINVCCTRIVQDAWDKDQSLMIHSWIYGLQDGLLRDLGFSVSSSLELDKKTSLSLRRYAV